MKNKLLVWTLCLLVLTGCSLADPDQGEAGLPGALNETPDALVGVVVTREHLDLFDADSFLQDNTGAILKGDSIDAGSGYYKKLYAVPDGDGRVAFDLPGSLSCFYYRYESEHGSTVAIVNDGIYEASPHLKSTDTEESVEMDGVIYVPAGTGTIGFFFNPVYQEPDGDVYLLPGQGTSMGGDNPEGASFSHKLSDSVTWNADGKTEIRSCSIAVTVEAVEPPRSIRLLQMDKDGLPISVMTWAPGEVPAELELHRDCAWAVLEQVKGETVTRSLMNTGDKYMESFYAGDGLVKLRTTTLLWPEK